MIVAMKSRCRDARGLYSFKLPCLPNRMCVTVTNCSDDQSVNKEFCVRAVIQSVIVIIEMNFDVFYLLLSLIIIGFRLVKSRFGLASTIIGLDEPSHQNEF